MNFPELYLIWALDTDDLDIALYVHHHYVIKKGISESCICFPMSIYSKVEAFQRNPPVQNTYYFSLLYKRQHMFFLFYISRQIYLGPL